MDHPKIKELAEKGHTITNMDEWHWMDLILHPRAWRWNDKMWDFLDEPLKRARAGKREAKE